MYVVGQKCENRIGGAVCMYEGAVCMHVQCTMNVSVLSERPGTFTQRGWNLNAQTFRALSQFGYARYSR